MLRHTPIRAHAAALAAIAAPIAIAQLSQMAMGLTDTLMLGRIGPEALAAGGLGANLFFTALWALQGVVSGVAVLAARARGANRPEAIPAVYWSGVAIASVLAIPFFWLMSAPGAMLRAAGEAPALVRDSTVYLGVLRWGVPAGLLGIGIVRNFLPALGLERLLLWVIPAGVALNLVLNIWLIYGGLGVQPLGMQGSAAATAITLWVSSLVLLGLMHLHPRRRGHVRLHWPRRGVTLELLWIGLPVAVTVTVEAALFLATALLIGALGQVPLAAHMVAISAASVTFMVPMAIAQAANVRVSHEMGAGRAPDARLAGYMAIGMAVCFGACAALAMLLAPGLITALYLGGASPAAALAVQLLRIAGAFQVFDGIQVTAGGALRGLKDTRVPMVLAAFGYWGLGFMLGRHLAFAEDLGARGLWWGLCVGLGTVAVSLTVRFAMVTRTLVLAPAPAALRHPA